MKGVTMSMGLLTFCFWAIRAVFALVFRCRWDPRLHVLCPAHLVRARPGLGAYELSWPGYEDDAKDLLDVSRDGALLMAMA